MRNISINRTYIFFQIFSRGRFLDLLELSIHKFPDIVTTQMIANIGVSYLPVRWQEPSAATLRSCERKLPFVFVGFICSYHRVLPITI